MFVNELHQGGIRAIIDYDNSVFDNMLVPEGIELEDVVDHILYKYGDAPLFSPDPSVIKFYIGRWSKRRLPLWEKYKAAIEAEYNPIENYDRNEKREFTHGKKTSYSGTVTDGTSGTITDTPSGTIKVNQDDTTTNELSADNASTYQADNKSTLDGETNTTYIGYKEERSFQNYLETKTYNNSDTNSGKDVEESRIHGNIGVTTAPAMQNEYLDVLERFDIIDYIADDFHSEFCLMMYY